MIPFLSSLLPTVNNIVDRLIPDKAAAEKAKADLAAMAMKGELDAMAGQMQINMKEAQSSSVFVAGWRPFCGWVCGGGLALMLFLQAIVPLVMVFVDVPTERIQEAKDGLNVAMGILTPILMTMLGARTVEKVRGVHRENMK